MEDEHPLYQLQYLIFTEMRDKHLDYYAQKEAWKSRVSPMEHLSWQNVIPVKNATKEIMSSTATRPSDKFVTVSSDDYSGNFYSFQDDDQEDGDEKVSFGENNVKIEFTDRHPGTSKESDRERGADEGYKYLYYRFNDATSPITTTASRYLFSVAFNGPNETPTEMKVAYKHQISLRIDEARQCLNLDCFEFKPSCIDVKAGNDAQLPTNRDLEKFHGAFNPHMKSTREGDSDDDQDDEWLDKTVENKADTSFSDKDILELSYQALVGNFINSRCLRLRLHLSTVTGIRLMASSISDPGIKNEGDIGAVLILESDERLGKDAFAARMVRSKFQGENGFSLTPDWTPEQCASKATRFYFYGNFEELKQTAALMAKVCPHLAAMIASKSEKSNSLRASVSVEYGTAPSFAEMENENAEEDDKEVPAGKKRRKLTTDDVHQALVDAGFVNSLDAAKEVNPCLKKAILLGYIDISYSTGETIVHEGSCVHCNKTVKCTMKNALFQSPYGGGDYEDGGEDAAVKCSACSEEEDIGGGNYITGLCQNKPSFDSGKYHNHCTECEDFGICIGDYRESHCNHCNNHYFRGCSGFSCPNCGGGKIRVLAELPSPPPSTWDGKIVNSMEVWQAMLEREGNPMRRSMMRMMLRSAGGPEADFNSSEVVGLMTAAMGAMGEGSPGEAGEQECCLM